MPDLNSPLNYDAWKTQGPNEDDNSIFGTYIQIGVVIDFVHDNPDDVDGIAMDARAAIMDALRERLGLQLDDIDISIDGATQERHES